MKEFIGIAIIIGCFSIVSCMESKDAEMIKEFKSNKEVSHVKL